MDIETLPDKKVAVDLEDKSTISLRDIYLRLCTCRDFEIKLQWERAVFLTAFLIACFAGYGSFLLSVHQHGIGDGNFSSFVTNGIFITLTSVGVVLSLLWILMAKGSKAWYEHYEQAIAAFAKKYATKDMPEYMLAHRWYDMPSIRKSPMSNRVLTFKGGTYSVSKIVIAIGVCSLLIWGMLFFVHCGVAIFGPVSKWGLLNVGHWMKVLMVLVIIVVAFLFVYFGLIRRLASGYLRTVMSIVPEVKDFKVEKTSWMPTKEWPVRNWIKGREKGLYVLIEKDKITVYEHSGTGITEKGVSSLSDCISEPEIDGRLFFVK